MKEQRKNVARLIKDRQRNGIKLTRKGTKTKETARETERKIGEK